MKNTILLLISLFAFIITANAQHGKGDKGNRPNGNGSVSGTVLDDYSGNAIEYANIVLYSLRDSSVVTGGITNKKGYFLIQEVPFGKYYMELNFIGYNKHSIENIKVFPKRIDQNIGTVRLKPATEMLNEVEIEAEQSRIDYKLDRKVINVEKDLNAIGGTAVDVLENVPSVQTDIDGNVSIRGSGNFIVLIDGRPSPLQGSEALQQIPSSSIKNIEIITNPSAKYDPDGVGGIINVILKKEKRNGINGLFTASYGSFNSGGGDFLVNIRSNKLNFFVGGDIKQRTNRGMGEFKQRTFGTDTLMVDKETSGERARNGGKIRAGFDYYITDNDIITISGQYGENGFGRIKSDTALTYWIRDDIEEDEYYYLNKSIFDIDGQYFAGDVNYMHKFMKKGHDIQTYLYYSKNTDTELNKYIETGYTDSLYNSFLLSDSTRTFENSDITNIRGKIDYTLPLFKEGKLETGYQIKYRLSDNEYQYQLGGISNQWTDSLELNNNYSFNRNIQSGYVIFSNLTGKFGYMIGVRSEYTNRVINQSPITENIDTIYNKLNFFPTLHMSYKLPWEMQLLASYSRRINRPRGHFLDPFPEVIDPYNIKQGNPMLEPEFTNAAEINIQKTFGKNFISFEAYYKQTDNKIERIKQVSETNPEILISTYENVGEDMSAGIEMMTNINLTKWWNVNLSGNTYYYAILSNMEGAVTDNNTISYGGRMNQTFRIKKTNTKIQLSGFAFGPSITSQGTSSGMLMANLAVKQEFLDNKLSITFNMRDIFNTANHEFIYDTPEFYSYNYFNRKSPTFNFTITYRLNDYKRRKDNSNEIDVEDSDI